MKCWKQRPTGSTWCDLGEDVGAEKKVYCNGYEAGDMLALRTGFAEVVLEVQGEPATDVLPGHPSLPLRQSDLLTA
jgi:hypothetical protein